GSHGAEAALWRGALLEERRVARGRARQGSLHDVAAAAVDRRALCGAVRGCAASARPPGGARDQRARTGGPRRDGERAETAGGVAAGGGGSDRVLGGACWPTCSAAACPRPSSS